MKIAYISLSLFVVTQFTSFGQKEKGTEISPNEITQGITMTGGEFVPNPLEGGESPLNGGDTQDSTNLNESKTTLKESLEEIERKEDRNESLKTSNQAKPCKDCGEAYTDAVKEMGELYQEFIDHLNNGGSPHDFQSDKGTITPVEGGGFHRVTSSGLRSSPDQNGESVLESEYSFCSRNGYGK